MPADQDLLLALLAAAASTEEDTGATHDRPCPGCGSTSARNLVVCIDGTSNQFSTKNTNVVELYSRLMKDENQLTFYNSGIGTYAKPSWKSWSYRKQVIANKLDLAFALRLEKIIISAYAWLVDNYQPGDRIFLFGFSRGAYQVRALAAMIENVGLLHKGNNDQIAFAYELYAASGVEEHRSMKAPPSSHPAVASRDSELAPLGKRMTHAVRSLASRIPLRKVLGVTESVDSALRSLGKEISRATGSLASRILPQREGEVPAFPKPKPIRSLLAEQPSSDAMAMQRQFKHTFSRSVQVHFVGAWDTVSSVGLVRDKTLPATTEGMKFVCFFRHALALHEYRVKFLPEYVNGADGPDLDATIGTDSAEPHTKEVWFTGSHSDIGGGSTANANLDRYGPALRWMSWEATLAGLRLDNSPTSWEPVSVSPSMTGVWRVIECLPIKHLSYKGLGKTPQGANSPRKQPVTRRPHLCANRRIRPGQRIHQSVYDECGKFKLPEEVEQESDAYIEAKDILRPVEEVLQFGYLLGERNSQRLELLTSSARGIQSLRELNLLQYIHAMNLSCRGSEETPAQIQEDLRTLYVTYVKGSLRDFQRINLPEADDCTSSLLFATFPFDIRGHEEQVNSVAFLSDRRVVSGSSDRTLRIWDVRTGTMTLGSPLVDVGRAIQCVAVHAAQALVASASEDGTIHLCTTDRNADIHTGIVLQDESSGPVLMVAFSPEGSHLVSGSADGATVRS